MTGTRAVEGGKSHERVDKLDAVRGIAALAVVFGHLTLVLHTIILLAVIHLIDPGNVDLLIALLPGILALSIGLSHFSQRWVERPTQQLGRRLARRVEGDRSRPSGAPISSVSSDRSPA